jgi:hypothetical protein
MSTIYLLCISIVTDYLVMIFHSVFVYKLDSFIALSQTVQMYIFKRGLDESRNTQLNHRVFFNFFSPYMLTWF